MFLPGKFSAIRNIATKQLLWRMNYADTSHKLELFEYNNKGKSADFSQRAPWKGMKQLNKQEATAYTLEKVMKGKDNSKPSSK